MRNPRRALARESCTWIRLGGPAADRERRNLDQLLGRRVVTTGQNAQDLELLAATLNVDGRLANERAWTRRAGHRR